jgi:hypothetical protein
MFRGALVLGLFAFASPAFALDKFAWQEVQRQTMQLQTERNYWTATVTEAARTTNREDTNIDRPLKNARPNAGGPLKKVQVAKPVTRLPPIRYKPKARVGGLGARLGGSSRGGGNFGRIFSGGGGGSFNFRGLSEAGEGVKPFSFGLPKK